MDLRTRWRKAGHVMAHDSCGAAAAGHVSADDLGTELWEASAMNRLASATSPYLLQHADNPVDWWEWGEGAFAEARRRDVPILLSIGYSSCHWCHLMR